MNINLGPTRSALAMAGAVAVLCATSGLAFAQQPDLATADSSKAVDHSVVAENTASAKRAGAPKSATASADNTVVVSTGESDSTAQDTPKDWGASLNVDVGVGFGTFVTGDSNNPSVVTTLTLGGWYKLAENLKIGVSVPLSWYMVSDLNTPLDHNDFLMYDVSLSLAHSEIAHDEDSGARLVGSFRIGLPTSLASQYQNRLFSFRPSFTGSIPAGPVTFALTFGFGKYFNSTSGPTVNCDDWSDPTQCLDGRDPNTPGGFESERLGAEVWVPGSGSNSFYLQTGVSVNWRIAEGLNLGLSSTVSNMFGVRYYRDDELSNDNAREGRNRTDRIVTALGLSYQLLKQLTLSTSLTSSTTEIFGSAGDSFAPVDFGALPSNALSWNFGITGTL